MIKVFRLPLLLIAMIVFNACATTEPTTTSEVASNAPPIPPGASEAPAVAACRVFVGDSDPLEFDECVESVTSDGTLILKPSTMKVVDQKLADEKKSNGRKHLWLMLTKEKSPNSIFGGPIVAYVGKGPSGVNLAREVAYFDNGPDYFEEGVARSIAKNGKVGFIDETLVTTIREEFDYATPFRKGLALACNACRVEDPKKEHSTVVDGDWRVLNKFGRVLKGPGLSQKEAFDAVENLTKAKPTAPSPKATATPTSKAEHP